VPVVEELHGSGYTDITLITGAGTAVGQWLVAVQGCDYYNASDLLSPSPGTWVERAGDGNLSFGHPHVKIWTRAVAVGGANSVTFDQAIDSGNHAHLYRVSNVDSFDVGAGSFGPASVSHVCPSLTATADGDTLINVSIGLTGGSASFDYTAPSGMVETDVSTWSTMGSHTEVLGPAGATGTRTHTASAAHEYASASIALKMAAGGITVVLGQAVETDTATAVVPARAVVLGQATETDTSQAVAAARTVAVGQAHEADTANPVTPNRTVVLGQAMETDTAHPVGVARAVRLGQAIELDTATAFVFAASTVVPDVPGVHTASSSVAGLSATSAVSGLEARS